MRRRGLQTLREMNNGQQRCGRRRGGTDTWEKNRQLGAWLYTEQIGTEFGLDEYVRGWSMGIIGDVT